MPLIGTRIPIFSNIKARLKCMGPGYRKIETHLATLRNGVPTNTTCFESERGDGSQQCGLGLSFVLFTFPF